MAMSDRMPGQRTHLRRLLPALAVSLLCHVLILGGWHSAGGPRPAAQPAWLQARLEAPDIRAVVPPLASPSDTAGTPLSPPIPHSGRTGPPRPAVSGDAAATSRTQTATRGGADTRVYLARELDHYPAPLVPIRPGTRGFGQEGGVRLWISIDQHGRVVEVAGVNAGPPGTDELHLHEVVLNTPFHPAYKDGRAVRSRLLLFLRYGP